MNQRRIRLAVVLCLLVSAMIGCPAKVERQATTDSVIDQSATDSAVGTNSAADAGQPTDQHEQPVESAQSGAGPAVKETRPAEEEITLQPVDKAGYDKVIDKYEGKVILVDFWATWCIPCRKGFPHTVEWSQKYAGKGLAVVSLSMEFEPQKDQQKVLDFLKKQKATFTNLLCTLDIEEEEAFEAFDVTNGALPHYKIYGRDGKLLKKFGGDPDKPIDHKDIEAVIRDALNLKKETD